MSLQNQIIVQSANKAVNISKLNGHLDLTTLHLFYTLSKALDFASGDTRFFEHHKLISKMQDDLKSSNPLTICQYKQVLPTTILSESIGTSETRTRNQNPTVQNFTVTNVTNQTLFGSGQAYATYNFKKQDFLDNYSDTNDGKFYSLVIFRDNLDGGNLKRMVTPTSGDLLSESTVPIEIPFNEVEQWSYYTDSTSTYIHDISFKLIDRVAGTDYSTQTRTLTIDRVATIVGNQPPTIGDNTIVVGNRSITTLTLAMVTSDLTPPYNDPEGDSIDAIRLVEISQANRGALYLDGLQVNENDIITKAQIEAGLLEYRAPLSNDGWADSFRFQARDVVNGQWVD